jgi:hypothetical protein
MYSTDLIESSLWPNTSNIKEAVTLEHEEEIHIKMSCVVHSSEN